MYLKLYFQRTKCNEALKRTPLSKRLDNISNRTTSTAPKIGSFVTVPKIDKDDSNKNSGETVLLKPEKANSIRKAGSEPDEENANGRIVAKRIRMNINDRI